MLSSGIALRMTRGCNGSDSRFARIAADEPQRRNTEVALKGWADADAG